MTHQKELEFATNIARQAGDIMRKYYYGDQGVVIKNDNTPVTIADKEINDLLIEKIKQEFPEDGVLGEEAVWEPTRDRLWVCDPIDGTVAYIMHVPTSMFSLAFVVDGEPLVAVAYNPWTNDLYSATKFGGTFRNDEVIHVSKKGWGRGIHLASASRTLAQPLSEDATLKRLGNEGIYVNNSIPGFVYSGCVIAEGATEGKFFNHTTPHDVAALKLIIEEAGGKVTDLAGNEQRYDRPINGAIMSNGLIHEQLLELVGQ